MDLQSVSIVLQFMRPARTARWPLRNRGQTKGMKAAGAFFGLPRELRERDSMLAIQDL